VERFCKTCGEPKQDDEMYANVTAERGGNICKECKRARDAKYRDNNRDALRSRARADREVRRDEINAGTRRRDRELRQEVIARYGGECACCGETRYEFLCIDHTNGGGTKHRQSGGGRKIANYLRRAGFPEGYRVLCWNCNAAIGLYGSCPHHG
jgi:hypothetical protein